MMQTFDAPPVPVTLTAGGTQGTTWAWENAAPIAPGSTLSSLCYWPYDYFRPSYQIQAPVIGYWISQPPTTCAGAVHVFPCPHCRTCVCGAATLTAQEEETS